MLAGCATELPAHRVALLGTSPIFATQPDEAPPSLCEVPILRERARCPAVHEKRVWISEDEQSVTCRLSVCGEDHVWRRSGGRWQDSTLTLR